MSKAALLKSTAVDVVQSQLPAKPAKREYLDFDRFVAALDELVGFFNAIEREIDDLDFEEYHGGTFDDLERMRTLVGIANEKLDYARGRLPAFGDVQRRLAEVKRDAKWYDRKELYDITRKGKREQWWLSRRVVAEQMALLLASFQNSRPGTPKVFGRMMTEEVYANGPNACVLESACRQVRREKDFPPSIAEVLKAIEKQGQAWCDRWSVLDDEWYINSMERRFKSAIADAESKLGEMQAKLTEQEAAEAKRVAAREARERERKEAEDRARDAREAKAAEDARRNEEWDRKWRAARALSESHPEIWEGALLGLSPKLAAQDAATLAAMHEAGGLFFYFAHLVRARLANGAKSPEPDDAMDR